LGVQTEARATWYLDITSVTPELATGTALLLDYGVLTALDAAGTCEACREEAAVGAFWNLTIQRESEDVLSFLLDGHYYGSYGEFSLDAGMAHKELALFRKNNDRYLSSHVTSPAGGAGVPEDVWNRIDLNPYDFTYVACGPKYFDQYVRVSDQRPAPDGLTLVEYWERRRSDDSLRNPSRTYRESTE
jgi:hypothetical protein